MPTIFLTLSLLEKRDIFHTEFYEIGFLSNCQMVLSGMQNLKEGVFLKFIYQFFVIIAISLVGEILNKLIPFPIPSSIYGIIILFLCLELKIIKLSHVEEVSSFMIEIMPVMFVPAAVGLINSWGIISKSLFSYIAIIVVSTFIVMGVSGIVTQMVINRKKRMEGNNHE